MTEILQNMAIVLGSLLAGLAAGRAVTWRPSNDRRRR